MPSPYEHYQESERLLGEYLKSVLLLVEQIAEAQHQNEPLELDELSTCYQAQQSLLMQAQVNATLATYTGKIPGDLPVKKPPADKGGIEFS